MRMVTLIRRSSFITFVVVLGLTVPNQLLARGEGPCTSGGFSISRDRTASISAEWCESHIFYELREIIGRDGPRPIYAKHDSMEVQRTEDTWVAACHGDGPFFTGVIILSRRPINYRSPDVVKAWKANLDTWRFESVDPSKIRCRLRPPLCSHKRPENT